MKILFVNVKRETGNGGFVVSERNKIILKQYVDEHCFDELILPIDAYCPALMDFLPSRIKNKYLTPFISTVKKIKIFHPDVIFFDNSYFRVPFFVRKMLPYTIYFFHNIESQFVAEEVVRDESNRNTVFDFIKRFYRNRHYSKVFHNEKKICKYADKVVCLNNRDSNELQKLYGRKADLILPTTMDDVYDKDMRYNINNDKYMLFVGTDFFGNTDGLFWFIDNCLDEIGEKLIVVGKGMDKYKEKYPHKNVEFLGYVNSLTEYYVNATCVILPIISGSGMKTKTCEALMYGKMIIGTDEAFCGYDNIDKVGMLRCNSKEEFVTKIKDYFRENGQKYVETSRQLFLDEYAQESATKKLFEFLDVLNNSVLGKDIENVE